MIPKLGLVWDKRDTAIKMPHALKSFPVLAVLFSLLTLALFACRQKEGERNQPAVVATSDHLAFLNIAPEIKYVGDEECALCHFEIFKSFKQTGMGRSFYPPSASSRIADLARNKPVYDTRSNLHYEVFAKGEELHQIEYRLNDKAQRTHELARKIDYVIGSGNHARTYLTSENGFLYELPLTWYSQKKSWGMSPGYAVANSRFSRPVVAGCMSCHNSYAELTRSSGNHYTEVPHGIGCERCHGPGELHVAKRYRGQHAEAARGVSDSTIVNPRRLPPALQMDVCYQCHLQGEVRVLKEGKQETDFRPGMRLREVRSVYVLDHLPPGDLRVASHGERLALSACYRKSNGKLVCITCHNPHQSVKITPRSSFNAACVNCHSLATLNSHKLHAQHNAGSDCIACHMPEGKTSDVVHVNFTDHWIQRTPFAAQADTAITLKDFFEEEDNAAQVRLGIAYLRYYETSRKELEYFERAVALLQEGLQTNPEHESGRYHLGLAYSYRNELEAALQQFRVLSKMAPQDALVFFELAKVLNRMGKTEEAIAAYQSSLQLWPDNAPALTQLGKLYMQEEQTTAAAAECFERARTAQPSYTPAHNALGEFFALKKNDLATARQHFLRALRYDPDEVAALNNLGTSAMAAGNYAESLSYFNQALARDPRFIPAYGNLAFVYALQGEHAAAQKYLRRALELDPNNARLKSMLKQITKTAQHF